MHLLCALLPALKTLNLRGVTSLTADGLRIARATYFKGYAECDVCLLAADWTST